MFCYFCIQYLVVHHVPANRTLLECTVSNKTQNLFNWSPKRHPFNLICPLWLYLPMQYGHAIPSTVSCLSVLHHLRLLPSAHWLLRNLALSEEQSFFYSNAMQTPCFWLFTPPNLVQFRKTEIVLNTPGKYYSHTEIFHILNICFPDIWGRFKNIPGKFLNTPNLNMDCTYG